MPALSAQYVSLVARACPGLFTEDYIRHHLPQERGWSYIHAWQLEQGHHTIWPDRRNPAVAWWEKIKARFVKNVPEMWRQPERNLNPSKE